MKPLVTAIALGAAGLLAWALYKSASAASMAAPSGPVSQPAASLVQGQTYAVQLMVDPRDASWGGTNTLEGGSNLIASTMRELGWKVAQAPALRRTEDGAPFLSGTPAEWTFVGTWSRPEANATQKPGWLSQLLAYALPTTGAPA